LLSIYIRVQFPKPVFCIADKHQTNRKRGRRGRLRILLYTEVKGWKKF
jgi:hypothetical protein